MFKEVDTCFLRPLQRLKELAAVKHHQPSDELSSGLLKSSSKKAQQPLKAVQQPSSLVKGILFYGPSGCGKTTLALCIAYQSLMNVI